MMSLSSKQSNINIKVFCRFRPFNQRQIQKLSEKLHRIANNHTQLIIKSASNAGSSTIGLPSEKNDEISFMYDYIFDTQSTQQQIFQQVGLPVLKNIIDGFNGTIMAYGQTSSGKTHTMQGYDLNDKQLKGIMPRIIEQLFTAIQKSPESIEYKLKLSVFELYMQKIRDLLDVSKNDLKIRESKQQGPYVENLTQVYVGDKIQLLKLIALGQKNRITCATNMNQHSSRSHMIFLLSLNQFNSEDSSSKTSKLFLIDLAGSQKISKTGAQGKVLQEAKKINLSLTNLGKVIKHLAQKNNHIPYRDSKLTRILKDSLGGNSKTTMIVTCSPHQMHLSETISTLRFGENAQKIKNKPKINRELTVQELQKIIEKLQIDINIKKIKIEILEKYILQTLKAQLPNYKLLMKLDEEKLSQKPSSLKSTQEDVDQPMQDESLLQQSLLFSKKESKGDLDQNERSYYVTLVEQLQKQLQLVHNNLQRQVQKHYQLKKQYSDLTVNLSEIIKENMQLQQQKNKYESNLKELDKEIQQLEILKIQSPPKLDYPKSKDSITLQQNENNSPLIKQIIGEIFSIIGPYQQSEVVRILQQHEWYKKVANGQNCVDFYEYQRQKLRQEIEKCQQRLIRAQQNKRQQTRESKRQRQLLEQFRTQKQTQNSKIMVLQSKLDKLFDQYHQMISLQTTWKAQCQLYERKLKKKQQKIIELQEMLEQLQEQIKYLNEQEKYEFQDTKSVKSRLIKPLKGGLLFTTAKK